MKKNINEQLNKKQYLLTTIVSISLIMLVVYFSFSLYGTKGTYSSDDAEFLPAVKIPNCPEPSVKGTDGYVCLCNSGTQTDLNACRDKLKTDYYCEDKKNTGNSLTIYECTYKKKPLTIKYYYYYINQLSDLEDDTKIYKKETVYYKEKAQQPVDPKYPEEDHSKYKFDYWAVFSSDSKYSFDTAVKRNYILYAVWKENTKYTISLDPRGGAVDGSGTNVIKKESVYEGGTLTLPNATKVNHKFLGWYDQEEEGKGNKIEEIVNPTKNITYYAHWAEDGSTSCSNGQTCWDCSNHTPRYVISSTNPNNCAKTTATNCGSSCKETKEQSSSKCTIGTNNGKYCFDCEKKTPRYNISATSPSTTNCQYTTAANCGSSCTVISSSDWGCYKCEKGSQNAYYWALSQSDAKTKSGLPSCAKQTSDITKCNGRNEVCWECISTGNNYVTYKWSNTNQGSNCKVVEKSDCKPSSNDGDNDKEEDNDSKVITFNATEKYPWSDGKTEAKTYGCDKETYISSVNALLKDTPDVVWNNKADCSGDKTIKEYVDNAECGLSFYPCAKSSSGTPSYTPSNPGYTPSDSGDSNGGGSNNGGSNNGGSNEGSSQEPTNPGIAFSDSINGDRCYNGSWVRIVNCQPRSVSGAQCKTKDGTLVKRSSLTVSYGCVEVSTPYTDVIDDYRCNKDTGKWIYISSCQSTTNTGAKCKTADSTILRSSLTNGYGCSSSKPGASGSDEDITNPKTSAAGLIIFIIIASLTLYISMYYFKKIKQVNN